MQRSLVFERFSYYDGKINRAISKAMEKYKLVVFPIQSYRPIGRGADRRTGETKKTESFKRRIAEKCRDAGFLSVQASFLQKLIVQPKNSEPSYTGLIDFTVFTFPLRVFKFSLNVSSISIADSSKPSLY